MAAAEDALPPIRVCSDADTPGIQALIARVFEDYGYTLDVEHEDPHLKNPGDYFRKTGGECWVATRGERVVGVCAVSLSEHEAELKTVYVDHAVRGRGLATRMVRLALEHAIKARKPCIVLWSDTLFVEAHRMYEKLGFQRVGMREMRLTNIFSEYRYEKDLTSTSVSAS